jgi:hypothetical protein
VKAAVDEGFAAMVGPRTPDDDVREAALREARKAASKGEGKAGKAAAGGAGAAASAPAGAGSMTQGVGVAADSVFAAREVAAAQNTPELVAAHVAATGGRIRTRFPPEPNGFLHIGHAKSMNLNFDGAFRALGVDPVTGGGTIFRYDDTNPDAEAEEYIVSQVRARARALEEWAREATGEQFRGDIRRLHGPEMFDDWARPVCVHTLAQHLTVSSPFSTSTPPPPPAPTRAAG